MNDNIRIFIELYSQIEREVKKLEREGYSREEIIIMLNESIKELSKE